MFVFTNNKIYRKISNLSFAPEVDITSQSIPINEFYVDIHTSDTIAESQWISLHDDSLTLWAKYWIQKVDRVAEDLITIHAQSLLARYDKIIVPAKWYDGDYNVYDILDDDCGLEMPEVYIHPSIEQTILKGYCPEQTVKERLQWVCFAVGAYVKTFFTDRIEILPLNAISVNIPMSKTYWRPSVSKSEFVSDIYVTGFSFTETSVEPKAYEEYIVLGESDYLKVTRTVAHSHIDPPLYMDATEIHIDDIYLIRAGIADNVCSRLASIYFQREEVEADIINNAEYIPSQMVWLPINPPNEIGVGKAGYIDSCDFSFGLQARSRIHFRVQDSRAILMLIVNYNKNNVKLGQNTYNFPVNTMYEVPNPYLDQTSGNIRRIYYPENETATGTMVDGTNINNQPYQDALIYYKNKDDKGEKKVLHILSVSGVDWADESEEVLVIE